MNAFVPLQYNKKMPGLLVDSSRCRRFKRRRGSPRKLSIDNRQWDATGPLTANTEMIFTRPDGLVEKVRRQTED